VLYAPVCLQLTSEATSGANANATQNAFNALSLRYSGNHTGDTGILLGNCDNNKFDLVWMYTPGTPGYGVTATIGSDAATAARSNYFYHLQVPDGSRLAVVSANGVPSGYTKNCIYGYDKSNGQLDPVAVGSDPTPAHYLLWIDSAGDIHGGQIV
jgi:hypothetical protein